MLKNLENDGTEVIGLVTPTPGLPIHMSSSNPVSETD